MTATGRTSRERRASRRTSTSERSRRARFAPRPRTAWREAPPAGRESIRKFVAELAWREFYHHVLFHFPRVAEESFRSEFDRMPWKENAAGLAAWTRGETGYPFVDAGMRELATTHWMHNRARMVAASFLTKDLHVHWKHGEKWFERQLADADLANNNGGWQWAAGSGTDAAPVLPDLQPLTPVAEVRSGGRATSGASCPELARVPDGEDPRTLDHDRRGASRLGLPDRPRLPRADPRPRPREGRRPGNVCGGPEVGPKKRRPRLNGRGREGRYRVLPYATGGVPAIISICKLLIESDF